MDATMIGSLIAFVMILVALVVLRLRNSKFEIRSSDAVVAVLPVAIVLLVTGKIQKFQIGDLKIETAFVNASKAVISSQVAQVTGLPSEPILLDPKGAVGEIPNLIAKKTQGLLFRIGTDRYLGSAIQEYLSALTKQPFLRYIIIENTDRTFAGLADARALMDVLSNVMPPFTANDVANWLNRDAASLKRLPGFLSSEDAVTDKTEKRQALGRLESLNADALPVIDEKKRFLGIVNRSRLTASLILDVANNLKQ